MDKFENIIKQAVEGYEAPFNPQAWENVSNNLGDSFDQAIKDSAGKYEAPYNPAAWEAVSSQLGPAYSAWKWVAGAAAVIAAVVTTVYITNDGGDTASDQLENNGTSSELAIYADNDNIDSEENHIVAETHNLDDTDVNEANDNAAENPSNNNGNIAVNAGINNNNGNTGNNNEVDPNELAENGNPTVQINQGGVSYTVTHEEEIVYEADAKFTTSNSEVCAGTNCTFTPSQTNSDLIYVWNFGDGDVSSDMAANHEFTRFGDFTISLEVRHPKTNELLAKTKETVTVNPLPRTDFSWEQSEEIIPVVNFINLTEEVTAMHWNIRGLKQSTQSGFEYTFRKAGQYLIDLTASNDYGCSKTIQKTIMIEQDYNLLAPTAFSPNGDFKNDVFIPKALQIMDGVQFTMNIMSKSGERVYTTQNVNEPWNGVNMNDNSQLPAGSAYVWQVVLTNSNGEKELYEGQVIIIR
ncbi:MAG: PKD repeat protein [Arenicella sp.]|jgi:PKD repeat protein